jgi:hypothetical protein
MLPPCSPFRERVRGRGYVAGLAWWLVSQMATTIERSAQVACSGLKLPGRCRIVRANNKPSHVALLSRTGPGA